MTVVPFPDPDPARNIPFSLDHVDVTRTAFLGALPTSVAAPLCLLSGEDVEQTFAAEEKGGSVLARAASGFFAAGGEELWLVNTGSAQKLDGTILSQLDPIPPIALLAAPGFTDEESQRRMLSWCQKTEAALAILDHDPDDGTFIQDTSGYGAAFGPWITAPHPMSGDIVPTPPSGHVAGAMVHLTLRHGIGRTLANVALRGATGITRNFSDDEIEEFAVSGVNTIRITDGIPRLSGAATTAHAGRYQSLAARRLANMISRSLIGMEAATCAEENGPVLWARLRITAERFLTELHRSGELAGVVESDAFHVLVDSTTTSEADRVAGRVHIDIRFAPTTSGIFVPLRVTLPTRQSKA